MVNCLPLALKNQETRSSDFIDSGIWYINNPWIVWLGPNRKGKFKNDGLGKFSFSKTYVKLTVPTVNKRGGEKSVLKLTTCTGDIGTSLMRKLSSSTDKNISDRLVIRISRRMAFLFTVNKYRIGSTINVPFLISPLSIKTSSIGVNKIDQSKLLMVSSGIGGNGKIKSNRQKSNPWACRSGQKLFCPYSGIGGALPYGGMLRGIN